MPALCTPIFAPVAFACSLGDRLADGIHNFDLCELSDRQAIALFPPKFLNCQIKIEVIT